MTHQVYIDKYKDEGARIFTDRDRGIAARKELGLDQLEQSGKVIVLLPQDTWGVNPSFFGGMFETSIRNMKDNFNHNYSFLYADGTELNDSLKQNLEDDFDYVMRGFN